MINYFETIRLLEGAGLSLKLGYHLDLWLELETKVNLMFVGKHLNSVGLTVGKGPMVQTLTNTYAYLIDGFTTSTSDLHWVFE